MSTETFRHQISFSFPWSSNIENILNVFGLGPQFGGEATLLSNNFNESSSKKNRKNQKFHFCGVVLDWVFVDYILNLQAMSAYKRLLTTSSDLFLNGLDQVD